MMYQQIIKWKKVLLLAFTLLGCMQFAIAGQPGWGVDPSKYTNSMVVIGALNFGRIESLDPEDKIAAFINGECRGLVHPMYVKEVGRYLAYLLIYSNESSGTVSFKMYDASEDRILDGAKELNFEVDGLIGNVARPFVWSNVYLNNETTIKTFSFQEQVKAAVAEGDEFWIEVKPGTRLTTLKPSFILSSGAVAFVKEVKQNSGITLQNFSEPVVYTIRSEDEQEFKDFTIHLFQKEEVLPVTNLLTPNGDGFNDSWEVRDIHLYKGFSLRVYDQNGSLVFASDHYANEWKGQNYKGEILPNGVYYYRFNDASIEYKGSVQLYK